MTDPIYLDYNATTPVAPEVAAAMRPFLHAEFGNPSSAHARGERARAAVAAARADVAALVARRPAKSSSPAARRRRTTSPCSASPARCRTSGMSSSAPSSIRR